MKSTELKEKTRDGSQSLWDTVGSNLRESQRTVNFGTPTNRVEKDPMRAEILKKQWDSVLVRAYRLNLFLF